MDIKLQVRGIAQNARSASVALSRCSADQKNRALMEMAEELVRKEAYLQEENGKDLEYARQADLSAAMLDRLMLKASTIGAMAGGLREVAALPDPVGKVTSMWRRPNGLLVGKMRIPLGVIGIIYESRPNVTADAAALGGLDVGELDACGPKLASDGGRDVPLVGAKVNAEMGHGRTRSLSMKWEAMRDPPIAKAPAPAQARASRSPPAPVKARCCTTCGAWVMMVVGGVQPV